MIDVSPYPMCAARLNFYRANIAEQGFTYYWAAVALVADISDKALKRFGGFDFSDKSDENGKRLLARLDQFIRKSLPKKAKSGKGRMIPAEASVRAILGANGIKVSKLGGITDYWIAAQSLWPDHVEVRPKVADITALNLQLQSIPKKVRGRSAKANIRFARDEWRAA